jgi:hypothetical protein
MLTRKLLLLVICGVFFSVNAFADCGGPLELGDLEGSDYQCEYTVMDPIPALPSDPEPTRKQKNQFCNQQKNLCKKGQAKKAKKGAKDLRKAENKNDKLMNAYSKIEYKYSACVDKVHAKISNQLISVALDVDVCGMESGGYRRPNGSYVTIEGVPEIVQVIDRYSNGETSILCDPDVQNVINNSANGLWDAVGNIIAEIFDQWIEDVLPRGWGTAGGGTLFTQGGLYLTGLQNAETTAANTITIGNQGCNPLPSPIGLSCQNLSGGHGGFEGILRYVGHAVGCLIVPIGADVKMVTPSNVQNASDEVLDNNLGRNAMDSIDTAAGELGVKGDLEDAIGVWGNTKEFIKNFVSAFSCPSDCKNAINACIQDRRTFHQLDVREREQACNRVKKAVEKVKRLQVKMGKCTRGAERRFRKLEYKFIRNDRKYDQAACQRDAALASIPNACEHWTGFCGKPMPAIE